MSLLVAMKLKIIVLFYSIVGWSLSSCVPVDNGGGEDSVAPVNHQMPTVQRTDLVGEWSRIQSLPEGSSSSIRENVQDLDKDDIGMKDNGEWHQEKLGIMDTYSTEEKGTWKFDGEYLSVHITSTNSHDLMFGEELGEEVVDYYKKYKVISVSGGMLVMKGADEKEVSKYKKVE